MNMLHVTTPTELSQDASTPARTEAKRELTIRLDGVFDGATAWSLRRRLEDLPPAAGDRVVVDFSKVREFYDFGVAVLAHGLAERQALSPRVILRGLRTHQLRLLRYFGVGDGDQGTGGSGSR